MTDPAPPVPPEDLARAGASPSRRAASLLAAFGGSPVLGVVAAWLVLALSWRAALGRAVFATSHDDFLRTGHAVAVGWDNLLPSDLWPPLPFWLTRLALFIAPDVRTTPGIVNLVCGGIALLGTGVLARRVGLSRGGAAIAVGLVAALPWWTWLSLSALAEPPAAAALVYTLAGTVGHARDGNRRDAWIAAVAVSLGGMVRYEVWGAALLHSLLLAPVVRRKLGLPPVRNGGSWLGPALLPWLFPLVWMALELSWNQDPLFFASVARENLVDDAAVAGTPLHAPRDLLLGTGLLLVLAALGAVRSFRAEGRGPSATPPGGDDTSDDGTPGGHDVVARRPEVRVLAGVTAIGLVAQLAAQWAALAGTHNTPRHYVAWAPALAVLGVAWGTAWWEARRTPGPQRARVWGGATGGLLLAVLPWTWAGEVPDAVSPDVARVGALVRTVRAGGTLGAADHVLLEAQPWESFALQVVIADPSDGLGIVHWDRDPFVALGVSETLADRLANPSLLAQEPAALLADLQRDDIGLVVTATPRGAWHAARVGQRIGQAGGWQLWRVDPRAARASDE